MIFSVTFDPDFKVTIYLQFKRWELEITLNFRKVLATILDA